MDEAILATKIAAVRDAVERIRSVLPASEGAFTRDRTVREVVALNLFVALQECLALSAHWVADAGREVPESHREIMLALADEGVIAEELAERLAGAAGLRNLMAHQYGVIDWSRLHQIASGELDDLLELCAAFSRAADTD